MWESVSDCMVFRNHKPECDSQGETINREMIQGLGLQALYDWGVNCLLMFLAIVSQLAGCIFFFSLTFYLYFIFLLLVSGI